jgi:Tol biopolymer transport system component
MGPSSSRRASFVCVLGAGLLLAVPIGLERGGDTADAASPREGRIAFTSTRAGGVNEIFVMNADGSDLRNVTNHPASDFGGAWSSDGSKLAFTTDRGSDEIFSVNSDGSDQENLTSDPALDEFGAAWSPDGKTIAYSRGGAAAPYDEIWLMATDGSDQRRLTDNRQTRNYDSFPTWSPDGSRIAFQRIVHGNWEIFVVNADGSGETNLTNRPWADWRPAWSHDGKQIAYTAYDGASQEIFVMNADGSNPVNLTNDPAYDFSPAWSPDDSRIAFTRFDEDGGNDEIFVMKADGSGQTNVTNSPASDFDPHWETFGVALQPVPPLPATARCRVPRVVGQKLAPARTRIRRAGCDVGRMGRRRSSRVGRVIAQSPRPGTLRPRGARIQLVVGRR